MKRAEIYTKKVGILHIFTVFVNLDVQIRGVCLCMNIKRRYVQC